MAFLHLLSVAVEKPLFFYIYFLRLIYGGSLDKRISKEYYGKFIPGKVDEIRLQRHDVDINFDKLPEDVLHIIKGQNNYRKEL